MRAASHPVSAVPGPRPTAARRAFLAALVLVAVSLVRPWGDGGSGSGASRGPQPGTPAVGGESGPGVPAGLPPGGGPPGAAPTPQPQPTPTLRPDQIACAQTDWRVVSLERLGEWTVRTSTPATATPATSPLDPAIVATTLQGPGVLALGACAPGLPDPIDGTDASAATGPGGPMRAVRAWRLDGGRATPVRLLGDGGDGAAGVAILYRATGSGDLAATAWPSGTYVLELVPAGGPAGNGRAVPWFMGLELRRPG